jgi:hypothetical protein
LVSRRLSVVIVDSERFRRRAVLEADAEVAAALLVQKGIALSVFFISSLIMVRVSILSMCISEVADL